MEKTLSRKSPLLKVLGLRDFRLLFSGATTSLLGDQFALIATPWLVLKLTGDPLALGLVLALEGIPRAVFMLLGGAITDRLSPRLIMLISDAIRFCPDRPDGPGRLHRDRPDVDAVRLRPGLRPGGRVCHPGREQHRADAGRGPGPAGRQLRHDGRQPAGRFRRPDDCRHPDRAVFQIAPGHRPGLRHRRVQLRRLGRRLWLDARRWQRAGADRAAGAKESVWASILAGIKYLWDDKALRLMFLVITAMNFLFAGPLLVGIPVLANQRLPEGAVAFGLLMSAYSGGNLAGYLLAGGLPRPTGKLMRVFLIALLAVFGLVLGALGSSAPPGWISG